MVGKWFNSYCSTLHCHTACSLDLVISKRLNPDQDEANPGVIWKTSTNVRWVTWPWGFHRLLWSWFRFCSGWVFFSLFEQIRPEGHFLPSHLSVRAEPVLPALNSRICLFLNVSLGLCLSCSRLQSPRPTKETFSRSSVNPTAHKACDLYFFQCFFSQLYSTMWGFIF